MSIVSITQVNVLDNPTHFANPYQFEITFECIAPLAAGIINQAGRQEEGFYKKEQHHSGTKNCKRVDLALRDMYLEWKIIYVGSADSNAHDQVLESIMVGPIPVGVNKFVFQADAPKPELIPHNDIVGVTVILITCSYQDKEFVRIGYYVNNDYLEQELRENPPEQIAYDKLFRSILAEKPRVTRFPINWDNPMIEEQPPLQTEEQVQEIEAAQKAQLMESGEWEDMEA